MGYCVVSYHIDSSQALVYECDSEISYAKTSQAFEHFNPLKSSPGSHSQSVSDSVGITSSCLLLVFQLILGTLPCILNL